MAADSSTSYLAFTKRLAGGEAAVSGLSPIVETVMTNVMPPCYGDQKEKIVLPEEVQKEQLSFTIEKEEPLTSCPVYQWRLNQYFDPHYEVLGITNYYEMQL